MAQRMDSARQWMKELGIGGVLAAVALFVEAAVLLADGRFDGIPRAFHFVGPAIFVLAVAFLVRGLGQRYLGWQSTDPEGLQIINDGFAPSVEKTTFRECEAMVEYALSHGLDVTASVLTVVVRVSELFPRPMPTEKLKDVEPRETPRLTREAIRDLARVHADLARLVAPATPRTLRLLNEGASNRFFPFLGRIRLVRHFEFIAVLLLAVFLVSAFHTDFSDDALLKAADWVGTWNAVNLLAAAGLGAAFFGLYRANQYVGRGTYDYKYEASYWARFTLGVVAGIVLAVVIPIGDEGDATASTFTKPLLALLGGFSADVVYRVLTRFVETLQTLIEGSHRELVATQTEAIAAREASRLTQSRTELSAELLRLEAALAAGTPSEQVRARIRQTLDQLLPTTSLSDPAPTTVTKAAPRKAAPRKKP